MCESEVVRVQRAVNGVITGMSPPHMPSSAVHSCWLWLEFKLVYTYICVRLCTVYNNGEISTCG